MPAVHDASSESENSADFAFNDAILRLGSTQENEQSNAMPKGRLGVFDGAQLLTALSLTVGIQIVRAH